MKNKQLPPIHFGKIHMEEFFEPMVISQYRLAKDISVPPGRINEIVNGNRIHYRKQCVSIISL